MLRGRPLPFPARLRGKKPTPGLEFRIPLSKAPPVAVGPPPSAAASPAAASGGAQGQRGTKRQARELRTLTLMRSLRNWTEDEAARRG